MLNQFKNKQFLIFLITGGIAASVNLFSRIIYNLNLSFSVSVVLAYITGMVTAFILAKIFVFKNSKKPLKESILFFLLVNLLAVMQTWLISVLLAYYFLPFLGIQSFIKEIAHACGVIIPVFTSYLGHKYFSFNE